MDANEIRTARESAGLSRADVARRLRVDQSLVFRWENAERKPSPRMLSRLRRVLGIAPKEVAS